MNYQGDLNLGDTLDIKFTTVATTGVPTTLAGSPAVAAYVDNGTTEITAGITLTVDFDARTGMHNVRVVASSGNTFSAGTNVNLVLTAGTVSGNSVVGYVVGSFSIEKRSPLRATTAGRTLDVTATGEAGIDWANIGGPTTTVNLSGTTVKTATDVETDTQDIQSRLPAALVSGRMNSDAVAISGSTATADAVETNIGNLDATVSSRASQTSLNAVDDFVDTEVGAIKVVTDKLDTALELDGAVYRYTVNALEQAPVGGGGGATDWTAPEREQIRSRLGLDGTASAPAATNPIASKTTVDAIKAKTDNLPSDPADASDIAASFASLNTKVDTIDDFIDTEVSGIKAKTDQLNFTGTDVKATLDGETVTLTSSELNAIADALLKRDWTALAGEADYSLLNAARMLRNVWATSGGTLTVKKENGTTTAWTRTLATDPAAEPIVGAS